MRRRDESPHDAPDASVVVGGSPLGYAMIDLMGWFIAGVAVVTVFIGAVIAALIKPAVLAIRGANRASWGAMCGVALVDMITMALALLLSSLGMERYFQMMKGHSWGLIVSALGLASLVHIMFAALPNALLVRTAGDRDPAARMGTGALLASFTPLIVSMMFLSLAFVFLR